MLARSARPNVLIRFILRVRVINVMVLCSFCPTCVLPTVCPGFRRVFPVSGAATPGGNPPSRGGLTLKRQDKASPLQQGIKIIFSAGVSSDVRGGQTSVCRIPFEVDPLAA